MDSDAEPSPAAAPSSVSPDVVRSYRWQLTPGEDVIDTATWAGSVPQVNGIAPRVRVGRSRWFNLLWLLPIGFVLLLIVAVAVAKGLRGDPSVQQFIKRYPGTIEPSRPDATTGFPAWARWQHFFNLFFMVFIIRSGHPDPLRPSAAVLDPALHARQGLVSDPEAGAIRTRSGRPSRTPSASRARSASRGFATPSAWPAGGTSASTPCGCSTA